MTEFSPGGEIPLPVPEPLVHGEGPVVVDWPAWSTASEIAEKVKVESDHTQGCGREFRSCRHKADESHEGSGDEPVCKHVMILSIEISAAEEG